MMRAPEFTNPNPSDDELWAEQERLQKQADKVLNLGILDVLRKYGEIEIGGSYKYGLMVYPDIDLSNIQIPGANLELFSELCKDVVSQPYVRKITTANTHDHGTKGDIPRPDGYWIGTEILFEGDFWGIDGWMQDPAWIGQKADSQKSIDYQDVLSELNHEQRTAILRIKYMCILNGIYGSKVSSGMVYDAVLNDEIMTFDELKRLFDV